MARTWAILGRVLRVPVPVLAPGDAPAGGEGEAEAEAERDAEAHGVAEEDEAADAQAGGGTGVGEAAAQPGADFSIPLAEPPRITVMTAAPSAHPSPEYPDTHPYILCVDSDCILLNFGVEPFMGACFDDRPYQSNLIVVRDYSWAGVEQGRPITATAERVPPRDGKHAIVCNVESIGIIYGLDAEDYVIAELMINKGRDRAILVYYYAGLHSKWIQEYTDNPLPAEGSSPPLPWLQKRDREWIPSGVVSYNKMLWWFDLSWGIISYDPMLETAEPLLLFHQLPEGQDLTKAQRVHDRRCVAVSQGGLRYVAITPDEADGATVSMWTRINNFFGWLWEKEFTVSFAEIWDHDSYTDTGLPRKVPVLAAVCPSNANMVYFALEDPKRLFGVNMYSRRVEEFINEPYELLTPGPEAPPSCRYVLPWSLPLEVAQALGEDTLAGDAEDEELIDEEELKKEAAKCDEDEEEQPVAEISEEEQSEPEVNSDPLQALADLLGPAVIEELPEIKDSELPVDESSSDEGTLSMVMDPATVSRLRSELEEDRLKAELEEDRLKAELEEERQSRNPSPGDDAGEGAI